MDFISAIKEMKEGKKVRRKSWIMPNNKGPTLFWELSKRENDGNLVISELEYPCAINIKNIEATDWEIVEDKLGEKNE